MSSGAVLAVNNSLLMSLMGIKKKICGKLHCRLYVEECFGHHQGEEVKEKENLEFNTRTHTHTNK